MNVDVNHLFSFALAAVIAMISWLGKRQIERIDKIERSHANCREKCAGRDELATLRREQIEEIRLLREDIHKIYDIVLQFSRDNH